MTTSAKNDLDRRALCTSLLSTAVSGCARSETGGGKGTKVRLGLPRNPVFYLPAYLAGELGYFEEEGLQVSTQDLPGGTKNVEAMLGGSADVIGAVYEHTIWLAVERRPVKCFFLLLERPGLVLAVSPAATKKIRSVRDLKGATVGVATPGSQSHMFVNYLLHRNGLSAADIRAVGIGLGPGSVAAIEHSKVDAGTLSGGAIPMLKKRMPGLVFLADACSPEGVKQIYGMESYPTHALLAPAEWLQRNPGTARKMARAVQRANRWVREHSAEQIREKIPSALRMEDTATELEAVRLAVPMMSADGRMHADGANAVRQVLTVSLEKVRTADIELSQTWTNEFLEPLTARLTF